MHASILAALAAVMDPAPVIAHAAELGISTEDLARIGVGWRPVAADLTAEQHAGAARFWASRPDAKKLELPILLREAPTVPEMSDADHAIARQSAAVAERLAAHEQRVKEHRQREADRAAAELAAAKATEV